MSVLAWISELSHEDKKVRAKAAEQILGEGAERIAAWIDELKKDRELWAIVWKDQPPRAFGERPREPRLTVGIAVVPATFEKIHIANGSPALANAPADQDVVEFELVFRENVADTSRIDVLTTKAPGGGGAIDHFLVKFGEGIQQIELDVTDVDRATEILRTRFSVQPIYPGTRAGANGTRVNFFLVPTLDNAKVLVELVEQPKQPRPSPATGH